VNPQLHDALSAAVATKRAQQLSPYARRNLLQDLDGPTLSNAPVSSVLPALGFLQGPGLPASGVPDVTFKTYQTAWQPTDPTLDDMGAGNFVYPFITMCVVQLERHSTRSNGKCSPFRLLRSD
jgi:hypothetical protein